MENHILPEFSAKAQDAYKALIAVNNEEGVVKFSQRVARAITMSEAGFLGENSPLNAFIFHGPVAMPAYLLAETLGQKWLGQTPDGSPSFVYVDCGAFSQSYPGVLSRLIGPLPQSPFMRQSLPLFATLGEPHFRCLAKDFLQRIRSWKAWFEEWYKTDIGMMGENAPRFYQELNNLIAKEEEHYRAELQKKEPFSGLLFLDAVDRACPELLELIRQILRQGNAMVWPDLFIDFSRIIIIMTAYEYQNDGSLGFQVSLPEEKKLKEVDRQELYSKKRHDLVGKSNLSGLIQDIGENLIILEKRTFASQLLQLSEKLTDLKERFQTIGISIEYSDDFIEGLCRNSQDIDFKSFTNSRLQSGISRYILYSIARFVVSQKIKKGASFLFEKTDSDRFDSRIVLKRQGGGEILTAQDIKKINFGQKVLECAFTEKDIQSGGVLCELNDQARDIMSRLKGG
ncbi:MAG: hypothetical protein HYV47_02550 [Candidatus Nealsonbacteria bacterium]|nr:hypothetical protein [Candidatus Nealsonbacteria bacterium]